MQTSEAKDLYKLLVSASHQALSMLKIPKEPQGKTRSWKVAGGPVGIGFHYTGGPDGIKSIKWFNHPGWGNTGSSCHCVVLDRLIDRLEDMWTKHEIYSVFKVPVIVCASHKRATWHINWANSRLWGIENRNTGYSGYQRLSNGLSDLGKEGIRLHNRTYEPYTRQQIEANILLARMWRAIRYPHFDPTWLVGHHQIWAAKYDPGPHFPSMHHMRDAVFSNKPITEIPWIDEYEHAPGYEEPISELEEEFLNKMQCLSARNDPLRTEERWHADPFVPPLLLDEDWVVSSLYKLGWPVNGADIKRIRKCVSYFQRSTLAYKGSVPSRVLRVDGLAGPLTKRILKLQLTRLQLNELD